MAFVWSTNTSGVTRFLNIFVGVASKSLEFSVYNLLTTHYF